MIWEKCGYEDQKEAEKILNKLKYLLTKIDDNGGLGIGNISEDARNAYDLYQVIRHQLVLEQDEPADRMTIDFDPAHQWGNQPFAEIRGLK